MIKKILFICFVIVLFVVFSSHSLNPYKSFFSSNTASSNFKATFLGTSSLLIQDEKNQILIDGFITRPPLFQLLFQTITPNKTTIDNTLKKLNIKRLDAIITLHSHHDHAMDSAYIASKTNATLIGSISTLNLAKHYLLKTIEISSSKEIQIGDFTLTILSSKHTPMGSILSKVIGINEHIHAPIKAPVHVTQYKEGGTYAIHIKHPEGSLLINGSTNYDAKALNGYEASTVFLGIAKLSKQDKTFQEDYFKEVVLNTKAKRIIPIHWDNFMKSLNEHIEPLHPVFDNFDKSMEFLIDKSKKHDIEIVLMDFFDEIDLAKKN